MKCTRCRGRAEVQLRQHNAAFCRPCFIFHFRRQVERAIAKQRMFSPDEKILVAVSGGNNHSLALKRDGTVVGWGANNAGQATPPAGLTGVLAIAASWVLLLGMPVLLAWTWQTADPGRESNKP